MIVAPFITAEPLEQLASHLDPSRPPQISLLTDLATDSLLQGSLNGEAIVRFCGKVPTVTIRHLDGLHAKAYVADEHLAIVTSGNLTNGSLRSNHEYGIQVTEPEMVRQVVSDLQVYWSRGQVVSRERLARLATIASSLREEYAKALEHTRSSLRDVFDQQAHQADNSNQDPQLSMSPEVLETLRGGSAETRRNIFSVTIMGLLAKESLRTREICSRIQDLYPDLCDEETETDGSTKWRHSVRGALSYLKNRKGLIGYAADRTYFLTP